MEKQPGQVKRQAHEVDKCANDRTVSIAQNMIAASQPATDVNLNFLGGLLHWSPWFRCLCLRLSDTMGHLRPGIGSGREPVEHFARGMHSPADEF